MKTIERVVPVMTHVNVGATLGMAAWVPLSGHLVVSGKWTIPPGHTTATPEQTTGWQQRVELPCCFVPAAQPAAEPVAHQPTFIPNANSEIATPWTFDDKGRARLTQR
ncbi:MAG: hypothetical protein ABL916_14895 [Burkholderiaceae bacterium]